MKNRMFNFIFGAVAMTGLLVFFAQCETDATEMTQLDAAAAMLTTDRGGGHAQAADLCLCLTNNFPAQAVGATESADLLYMREEEKLARDVYTAMNQKWNIGIFANITKAEQRHMDAMNCLLQKYQLTDPVGNNPAGVFSNSTLQQLYNNLIAQGNQSAQAALTVGATIEDLDIADLLTRSNATDNADIKAVYNELTRGSRNHLRAFVNNLSNQGVGYTPAYITAVMFQDIIATPRETGNGICGACPNGGTGAGNCNNCPNGTGQGNGIGNGSGNCNGAGPKGNGHKKGN
jgi:hypothetical protein